MKINNIGVQSYQQLNQQANAKPFGTDRSTESANDSAVNIEPKSTTPTSKLAVQAAAGSFADSLTTEERQALEMLFARFRDSGRFGTTYRSETGAAENVGLGSIIDVKV